MTVKPILKALTLTVFAATLGACAAQAPMPQQTAAPAPAGPSIPDWVTMPYVENGLADTQCLLAKKGVGMNYLKSSATALARAELARQIGVRVQAMDKTYQRLAETTEGMAPGASFESVSKQVTDKHLAGSRAIKMDYVMMPESEKNFCVMVAMSPETTKNLFSDLIQESDRAETLSPQNESVLYERFLADKAAAELNEQFPQN